MPFARQSVHDPLKEETSSPKSRLPRSSIVYHEETKPPQPIARPRINIDLTQIPTLAPEPSPVLSNPLQKRLPKPQIQAKLTIGRQNDKYEQEADTKAAQEVKQINTPASTHNLYWEGKYRKRKKYRQNRRLPHANEKKRSPVEKLQRILDFRSSQRRGCREGKGNLPKKLMH